MHTDADLLDRPRVSGVMLRAVCAALALASVARAEPPAAPPQVSGATKPGSTVLVLHSYHRGTLYTELQEQAIREVLMARPGPLRPRVVYDYLVHTPLEPAARERLFDVLEERHRHFTPDLILTTDTPALEFAIEYGDRLRPGIPVVFSAATSLTQRARERHVELTGVIESIDIDGTLDLAVALFPTRTHCVGITDDFGYGQMLLTRVNEAIERRGERLTVEWLSPRSVSEIRERLAALDANTFVLFCTNSHLSTRAHGVTNSEFERLCRLSAAPVFVLFDIFLGEGAVGGRVASAEHYGRTAAELALRVLDGEPASQIPVLSEDTAVTMFDWRALQRWGIRETSLPPGSVVRYRVPTFFEQHRTYVIGGAAIVSAQTLTIALLVLNRLRLVRSRRALQASRERYVLASKSATVYVWDWDLDDNQTRVDPAFLLHLGYAKDDERGGPEAWFPLVHPDDLERSRATTEAALSGALDRIEIECRLRTAQGDYRWFMARGQRVSVSGRLGQFIGTVVDIHSLKEIEDALRESQAALERRVAERTNELSLANAALRQEIVEREQAQLALSESEQQLRQQSDAMAHVSRVAMVGEMAAGLAHEINQPLTAAMNHAEASIIALKTGSADASELLSDLETIAEQTSRVGQIVRNLRGFVSNRDEQRGLVPVEGLLRDVIRLSEFDMRRSGGKLTVSVEPDLPPVVANAVQMQQVLLNLIRNAIEAMSDCPPSQRSIHLAAARDGAELIEVSVADRGRGVSHADRTRIFDPFFTTRTDGLGLGLSISRTIVARHGGTLSYKDNVGGGAVFTFTVPIAKSSISP